MADTNESALTLPGLPAARSTEQVVVEGITQKVVYASPDGEFAVLRLEVAGESQPLVAIGALAGTGDGETLRLVGTWETHPTYGRRLRVIQAVPFVPRTSVGVERYLASLAGLGPESARRLVDKLGVTVLELLETEPWRVSQVKGVGKRRVLRAAADAKARREEREVMVFLQGHGVSAAYAHRIRKTYGEAAMARVSENPYRLARDVAGIGFQIADRIAQAMGIDRLSPLRIEAGLIYTLENAGDSGHCYLPAAELYSRALTELRIDNRGDASQLAAGRPEGPAGRTSSGQLSEIPPPRADPQALLRDGLTSLGMQQAIVLEGDDAYTPRLHRAEVTLARRLLELRDAERAPVPPIGDDAPEGSTAAGPRLAPGQRRALELVAESPVCVITGGPGTGKTTIIRRLVSAWDGSQRAVLLVAPTGRAAKRLSEATGHPAATVHRQLEWAPKEGFRRRSDRPLECDILVCDEASMLDLPLARALLAAVPLGATLVLVGDVDQLPSVGPGRVLADIIDSGAVPVARLTEIFRQAEGSSIVANAHRICHGQLPVSAQRVGRAGEEPGPAGDFFLIETDDPLVARDLVVRCCQARIPQRFGLDPLRDVQVLTPMHRGEVGTEELNRVLQEALNPPPAAPLGMLPADRQHRSQELRRAGRAYRIGDKVMQVRNDYDRDVWNGDVGLVYEVNVEDSELMVRFDDREVRYGVEDLEQLELAYAVSIHKSQGSEYPAVVVPLLMQHYVLLRRNLLYTAVTRGKQLVVLIGSRRALARAVNEASAAGRYTHLAERLRGAQVLTGV